VTFFSISSRDTIIYLNCVLFILKIGKGVVSISIVYGTMFPGKQEVRNCH
jgi:hypothetical protein